jgi:hypothetical protein
LESQRTSISSTKDPPRRIPISKTSNPIHRYTDGGRLTLPAVYSRMELHTVV